MFTAGVGLLKMFSEFLSRFFANRGYEDGLHGLGLSLLQAFSFLVLYLKLWELKEFKDETINLKEFEEVSKKVGQDVDYWLKTSRLSKNPLKRILQKAKNKLS